MDVKEKIAWAEKMTKAHHKQKPAVMPKGRITARVWSFLNKPLFD